RHAAVAPAGTGPTGHRGTADRCTACQGGSGWRWTTARSWRWTGRRWWTRTAAGTVTAVILRLPSWRAHALAHVLASWNRAVDLFEEVAKRQPGRERPGVGAVGGV